MSEKLSSHFAEFDLAQWLSYIESIHAKEIDMGLSRISQVLSRLNIDFSFANVITVAGTNGKGTTCAFMETAFISERQSVAVYSSPHIEHFNERLRVNKQDVDNASFVDAFMKVEIAREDVSLSYYEFTTLAAFVVLMQIKPDVIILEVGLGGRLDATNVIDADVAVITTIDLDHQAFLGDTRELIGFEKAGIMRPQRLAIIGDKAPPQSLVDFASSINANAMYRNESFNLSEQGALWTWQGNDSTIEVLNAPSIPKDNVATALMVLSLSGIALDSMKVNHWIANTQVAGRTELFSDAGRADVMLDVGHNPLAARYLKEHVAKLNYDNVHVVIGMLKDKDIKETVSALQSGIANWYIGGLSVPRGASAEEIVSSASIDDSLCNCFDNVIDAYKMAREHAKTNDLILVCGSFFTVAEIRRVLIAK